MCNRPDYMHSELHQNSIIKGNNSNEKKINKEITDLLTLTYYIVNTNTFRVVHYILNLEVLIL